MNKLEYLVIHCADTPMGRIITPDDIDLWHLGAKIHGDGTMTYMGQRKKNNEFFNKVLRLPSGLGVPVMRTNGRGWKQRGYADMIDAEGNTINLTPYDFDDYISPSELTNGAAGYNRNSRHVLLPGGKYKNNTSPTTLLQPEELFSEKILNGLVDYIKMQQEIVPGIKIVGHNDLTNTKLCPGFVVSEFVAKMF